MTTPRRSERARKIHDYSHAFSESSDHEAMSDFNEDLEHDEESDVDTKPRRTRRKRQKIEAEQNGQLVKLRRPDKCVRGRRGHLKLMTEMPIDTLHEIFRQLDPLDLLYLSWANKSLRGIVMEESARYIWEEVYERLYESDNPPPRCPEDINLAQYTRFLYYKKCMMCQTRNGPYTCWMMRLRVCNYCLANSNQFIIPDDYDPMDNLWFMVETKQTVFMFAGNAEIVGDLASLSDSEREERRRLKKGEGDFDAWEEQCTNSYQDRKRTEKHEAIFKRLKEIGWDESSIREMNDGQLPDIIVDLLWKNLTNKGWKEIRPEIEEALSEMKERHLKRLKGQRFSNRWNSFQAKFEEWDQIQTLDSSLRPRADDIAVLEPFDDILFASDTEGAEFEMDDIDRVAKEWIQSTQTVFVFASDAKNVGALFSDSEMEKRRELRIGKERFHAWEKQCYEDLRDRKRAKRCAAIFEKLKDMGWDESSLREINYGHLPIHLPGLDSGKKLTKKDWEDIRPKLECTLSQMKQGHLDHMKARPFLKRWNSFEAKFEKWNRIQTLDSSLRPHAMDIAVLEPFHAILFASDTENAEFKIDDIDRVTKEWIKWRDNFLFSLLPQDLQDRYQANKSSLQLLTILRFFVKLHNVTLYVTLDHLRIRHEQQVFYTSYRSLTPNDHDGEIRMAFR